MRKLVTRQRVKLIIFTALIVSSVSLFVHAYDIYFVPHRLATTKPRVNLPPESSEDEDYRKTLWSADDTAPRSLEEIHETVSSTKGFYARDWTLWLGWNNLRYTIESSLLHAKILNRTLVLPSFIYARGCELSIDFCAVQFDMVNKNDALRRQQWINLPPELQVAWRIPISLMLDLHWLQNRYHVILVSEYLRLHGLPESMEASNGAWERWSYHSGQNVFTGGIPSLFTLKNSWFDNETIVRVDKLTEDMKRQIDWDHSNLSDWRSRSRTIVYNKLLGEANKKRILEWPVARRVLRRLGLPSDSDDEAQLTLKENGWEVIYTYDSPIMMKLVMTTIRQAVPRVYLKGLEDDFGGMQEDVLLLEGETHLLPEAVPGDLRLTSADIRSEFTNMVLHDIRPPTRVLDLANILSERMSQVVDGRMWVAAHMRRDDFVRSHWISTTSITSHLRLVRSRLELGIDVLTSIQNTSNLYPEAMPEVASDLTPRENALPQIGDPFYIATDERSPQDLKYLSDHGGVLLRDLLTSTDRRAFGPSIWLTDVLGLVEQAFLGQSSYFYGSEKSSFTGGVVNKRAANGADPRTSAAD